MILDGSHIFEEHIVTVLPAAPLRCWSRTIVRLAPCVAATADHKPHSAGTTTDLIRHRRQRVLEPGERLQRELQATSHA